MVSIRENIEHMTGHVARSRNLWRHINTTILNVLRTKRSRAWMARRLRLYAGRKEKGEPVSIDSLRIAARQIERGEKISVI